MVESLQELLASKDGELKKMKDDLDAKDEALKTSLARMKGALVRQGKGSAGSNVRTGLSGITGSTGATGSAGASAGTGDNKTSGVTGGTGDTEPQAPVENKGSPR